MTDLMHEWGGDLAIGADGDLATVTGSPLGQQRVLRRLLTNTGDYIWQLRYGAGLPQAIGGVANPLQIQAIIRSQIFSEAAVSATPEPQVAVAGQDDGSVYVRLRYTDAATAQTQLLNFSLGA